MSDALTEDTNYTYKVSELVREAKQNQTLVQTEQHFECPVCFIPIPESRLQKHMAREVALAEMISSK